VTTLESNSSNGIISITNESQWSEAEGKIIAGEAFEGRVETQWTQYSNALQWHVLLATNQAPLQGGIGAGDDSPVTVHRQLYQWELNYIHTKFFGGEETVRKNQADNFWVWFGQVLMGLHFKRHILPLWQIGCIYGMITKDECHEALRDYPEGTFLVRFSESNAGSFAIGYATSDKEEPVKHFLVKPEDLGANRTLPDFLKDKPQLRMILQVTPSTREARPIDKDEALNPYYSKRKAASQPNASASYSFL